VNTKSAKRQHWISSLAAIVIIIAGMKAASPLVVPFLLAVFLAIICSPFFLWMQRKGLPAPVGVVIIVTTVLGIWLLLAVMVTSSLGEFSQNVPFYQERLKTITDDVWLWVSEKGLVSVESSLRDILNPGRVMKLVAGTLNSLGSILTNVFFILLMFVTILFETSDIPRKIIAIRGDGKDSLLEYEQIIEGVNRYLALKTMTSFFTAVSIYLLLYFQGIDFAFLWALLAFLLNYIPNIGSIIASIPVVLLALVQQGFQGALITAIGYLTVNTVVGSILEPKIMGKGIGLSTLVVLLSMVFWGWVLGPIGTLLSVPLTMTVKIALWNSESGRWVALLLGSGRDVTDYLELNKEKK